MSVSLLLKKVKGNLDWHEKLRLFSYLTNTTTTTNGAGGVCRADGPQACGVDLIDVYADKTPINQSTQIMKEIQSAAEAAPVEMIFEPVERHSPAAGAFVRTSSAGIGLGASAS